MSKTNEMSELLKAMNGGTSTTEQTDNSNQGDSDNTPSVQSPSAQITVEPRDVVAQVQANLDDIDLTIKAPKGKTAKFGDVELPVREDHSPDDLKYIPTSNEYIDNKGLLNDIAKFVSQSIPVLIEGETGTGKTSAARYMASQTQSPYRRLNLNGSTTVDEFVGRVMLDKEGTYWVDGVLIDAMRKGHWLVLDEINAALPEILFVLHSLLDDDGYVVLAEKDGEVVRPHANFRVFATMNPTEGYSGTKDLNTAFLDRFVKMTFEFPTLAQERKMVEKRFPSLTSIDANKLTNMLKYAGEMRTAYSQGAQEFLISPRGVLQWVQLSEMFGDINKAAEYALINKAPAQERNAIRDVLKLRFGMGLFDYEPQCKVGNLFGIGDEVVVSMTVQEARDFGVNIPSDYLGVYTVTDVQLPPARDGETTANDRVGYTVKCTAKNQKADMFNGQSSGLRLGKVRTAKYHGDNSDLK